jgi:hypothetical protein
MEKQTLKFSTLSELTGFSKSLKVGFLINTKNLTLTSKLSDLQINVALEMYNACRIETNEKVYSYDLL